MGDIAPAQIAPQGIVDAGWWELREQVRRLAEDVTELGLVAEEIFKTAASGLFGHEFDAAQSTAEQVRLCNQTYYSIHRRALELLAQYAPSSADLRRIVELQQNAADFTRIADHGRQIAQSALELAGTAEDELAVVDHGGPTLLYRLVRQAYIQLRGCVVVATSRDTAIARRVVGEDGELDQLYLHFKRLLDHAIARNPLGAFPLQQLMLIGAQMEEIGNRTVAICRTVLHAGPHQTHG